MGWFAKVHGALNPMVQMLRPISPIAWIPLAILWFGVGNLAPMFLIFLASFFPLVVQTAAGIETVEQEYIRAGRNYGFKGLRFFRQVVIPAALPDIVVGVRVALGVAWLVVVAGEMVAIIGPSGSGPASLSPASAAASDGPVAASSSPASGFASFPEQATSVSIVSTRHRMPQRTPPSVHSAGGAR